ncbi:NUDIX hydrolase [Arcanobacterium hippocoleae]|uniref:NUDIX hydrolase n=1 Tax=Arcanobacterium hippocoleae TaxID=149017 RepID=UPI002869EF2B|nr:NUDIX domain-containing protein [Arcanobacterium hippocoleae]
MVHRPRWRDWSFPKGKLKPYETMRACAVREIREETRLDIVLGVSLGWQNYFLSDGKKKAVHFWAARVVDAKSPVLRARKKVKPAPKHEIDQIMWIPAEIALGKLTYERDVRMLRKLLKFQKADALDTQTLIVLRHAKAIKRDSWKKGKGPEHTRPLARSGEARAQMLVSELSAYGIDSLRTSPWRRCVSTLEPYAKLTGVNLRRKNGMTERSYVHDANWLSNYFREMIGGLQKNRAICIHRPTIPGYLQQIKSAAAKKQFVKIPQQDPWLEPGQMIVLHLTKKLAPKHRIVQIEIVNSDFRS